MSASLWGWVVGAAVVATLAWGLVCLYVWVLARMFTLLGAQWDPRVLGGLLVPWLAVLGWALMARWAW
jgi:hypothetical protein